MFECKEKFKMAFSGCGQEWKIQPNTMQANQYTAKNVTGEEGN